MESRLIFNQLICEFESRHPCHSIANFRLPIADWGIAILNKIGNRQLAIDNASVGRSSNWQSTAL
jgi:hypothetical protein